ncbi:MAG: hypothetical protein DLM72_00535, partial [Candidatus Nitrosopolaris wilkensis]
MTNKIGRPQGVSPVVEERRKKVLELNHTYHSLVEIAKIMGIPYSIVEKDLYYLQKDVTNKTISGKKLHIYRAEQKASLPEPAKKIECPACNGMGKYDGEECLECDHGQKDSFYGNIVKEPNLVTRCCTYTLR